LGGTAPPQFIVVAGELDGQGGIRTHDTLAGIPVFETGSFSHSDTCPNGGKDKASTVNSERGARALFSGNALPIAWHRGTPGVSYVRLGAA
jgi:hypothetical protein